MTRQGLQFWLAKTQNFVIGDVTIAKPEAKSGDCDVIIAKFEILASNPKFIKIG